MKHYINKDIKNNKCKHPCSKCGCGSGSYSNGKDEVGEYIEVKTCHDTCEKLKIYNEREN